MRTRLPSILALASLSLVSMSPCVLAASPQITLSPLGTYRSGSFDRSAAEIVAHDPKTQRLFVVNAQSGNLDVLNIRDPAAPTLLFNLALGGVVNSVDVYKGLIAAAIEAVPKTDPGKVVFLDADGRMLASVVVGVLPDMLKFTPDGKRVLVANEGEPNDAYTIDPEGSVSIIDLPEDIGSLTQAQVRTATFTKFNGDLSDPAIRVFGPAGTVAQNLEPEYITVDRQSRTAWVTLQEANAIAVLDIGAGEFTALRSLGFKDHLLPGNELDVSDENPNIRIGKWPVYGMYQPDAIASYEHRGRTFLVTANEGDSREWTGYSEIVRFRALSGTIPPCADSPRLQAFLADNPWGITTLGQLRDNQNMGRLQVTRATGLRADGTCYEDIYAYGGRSFSIWSEELELMWDSGSQFERIVAARNPQFFNSNHTANNFKSRSDDKGPEPEGIAVAKLWGSTYAFVALERIGGVMIYDITDPYAPAFVDYVNYRNFTVAPGQPASGDQGAEGLTVIAPEASPMPGVALLAVANEVSGTTTVFRVERIDN